MRFTGVVSVPRRKIVPCKFDLDIMRILINVYVLREPWRGASPCFNWLISGMVVGRGWVAFAVCSALYHFSNLRALPLKGK